jgi:hypothetical protein
VRGAQGRGLDDLTDPVARQPVHLRARDVVRGALRIYRDRFRRVACVSVVVFGLTGLLDAFVETVIEDGRLGGWVGVLEPLAAAASTFGLVLFAGVLDVVLDDHLAGRPDRPMRRALADLPLTRLLIADAVVTVVTLLGYVLLVVPGVVAFTLLCITGPVIVAERRGVVDGLRRSVQLVRARFWLVLLVVTVPVSLEEDIAHAIDYRGFDHPLVAAFVVAAVVGGAVSSFIGLVEVVLAHELATRNRDDANE